MSFILSIIAIIVSILSLFIAWYFNYRDKAKLVTFAKYYEENPNYDRAHIEIKIVNCGRRPTILTMFGGDLKDGGWYATYLGKEKKGIRLTEHEKYETSIYIEDLHIIDPDGNESYYINLWFENTLGQRFLVSKSENLIEKLSK